MTIFIDTLTTPYCLQNNFFFYLVAQLSKYLKRYVDIVTRLLE